MGGCSFLQASASGQPTLNTPRMSPADYERLKQQYLQDVRELYPGLSINCLREAPEKVDYGDIDFIIASDEPVDFVLLAYHLGARGLIQHNKNMASIGVLVSGERHDGPAVLYKHHGDLKAPSAVTPEVYAQIDIQIVPTRLNEWHLFYASNGDMGGILGHIVKNLGFTVSDTGLWLRMQELDDSKGKDYQSISDRDGMLLLSHDPVRVMEFLGLDVDRYKAGFATLEALYEWLGACTLIDGDAVKEKRDNAHERNRERKRVVFSRFFNEWLPAHFGGVQAKIIEETTGTHLSSTEGDPSELDSQSPITGIIPPDLSEKRKQRQEEAIAFFGKRNEFEIVHNALVKQVDNATAGQLLKDIIPRVCFDSSNQDLNRAKHANEIVKAFRRYVAVNEAGRMTVLDLPHEDKDSQLHRLLTTLEDGSQVLRDGAATEEFVRDNWKDVRVLERKRLKDVTIGKKFSTDFA